MRPLHVFQFSYALTGVRLSFRLYPTLAFMMVFFYSVLRTFWCIFVFIVLLYCIFVFFPPCLQLWICAYSMPLSALQKWKEIAFTTFVCNVCLRVLSLSPQLSLALEEKFNLQAETRSLKEKLSRFDSLDIAATTITGKKLLLLQSQMEQLQEENYRYS